MQHTTRGFSLVALLALLACEGRLEGTLGPGRSINDRTRPTVVATNPSHLATQVGLGTPAITVTFSEPMSAASVSSASISFSPSIPGMVSYTGATATLAPSTLLAPGTVYTGTVSTHVEDRAGNNLATPFTWTFTTSDLPPS